MEVFMIPVSVCMIAKNEETYIGECLKRLSSYDWEIILVDTGSTDRTVEIARQYTPHIYHFDWCGDFSAARNYSISKASHDLPAFGAPHKSVNPSGNIPSIIQR